MRTDAITHSPAHGTPTRRCPDPENDLVGYTRYQLCRLLTQLVHDIETEQYTTRYRSTR